jgi:hypothetical protein
MQSRDTEQRHLRGSRIDLRVGMRLQIQAGAIETLHRRVDSASGRPSSSRLSQVCDEET